MFAFKGEHMKYNENRLDKKNILVISKSNNSIEPLLAYFPANAIEIKAALNKKEEIDKKYVFIFYEITKPMTEQEESLLSTLFSQGIKSKLIIFSKDPSSLSHICANILPLFDTLSLKDTAERDTKLFYLHQIYQIIMTHSSTKRLEDKLVSSSVDMIKTIKAFKQLNKNDLPLLIQGEFGTGKTSFIHYFLHHQTQTEDILHIDCKIMDEKKIKHLLLTHQNQVCVVFSDFDSQKESVQNSIISYLFNQPHQCIFEVNIKENSDENPLLLNYLEAKKGQRIHLIPLRERKTDIVLITEQFLYSMSWQTAQHWLEITQSGLEKLQQHYWMGNITELLNTLRSALILSNGKLITSNKLKMANTKINVTNLNLKKNREKKEKDVILKALVLSDHNMSKAAKVLGISRPTLYSLITKYQLNQH